MPRSLFILISVGCLAGCSTHPALPHPSPADTSTSATASPLQENPAVRPDIGIPELKQRRDDTRLEVALKWAAYWLAVKEPQYTQAYLDYIDTQITPTTDPTLVGHTIYIRGLLAENKGATDTALQLYQEAYLKMVKAQNIRRQRDILNQKEIVEHNHGYLEAALGTNRELIRLADEQHDDEASATHRYEQGMIAYKLGRWPTVDANLSAALEIFTRLDLRIGMAHCWKLSGLMAAMRGHREEAIDFYEKAYALLSASGDNLEAANCRLNASITLYELGDYPKGDRYLNEAEILFIQSGALEGVGICYMNRGNNYTTTGDYLKAEQWLKKAEDIFLKRNQVLRLAQVKTCQSLLARKRGDIMAATDYAVESQQLMNKVPHRP